MNEPWRVRALGLAANCLMAVGTGVFSVSLLLASVGLVEGVTHRVGEGDRLPQESPEQARQRLLIVGCLLVVAAGGWVLARLGDSWRQVGGTPWRHRLGRLAAEALLFLGGACLAVAALIGGTSYLAVYGVGADYRRVAAGAVAVAPVLLGTGWVLYRRQVRPAGPAERQEPVSH